MLTKTDSAAMATQVIPAQIDIGSARAGSAVDRAVIPMAALVSFHALLAVAMKSSSTASTALSMMAIFGALAVAAFAARLYWIPCAAAYIVGSEVLWRMTGSAVLWEAGKYATSAVLLIGLVRMRRYFLPVPAVMYFLFLMPGVIVTCFVMIYLSPVARLSAHFSGPLTLTVCLCFFLNCQVTKAELNRILLALAVPITSICFIAARGTFTRNIRFGTQSLDETSGDFGPNQVSAMLGLGALVLVLYLLWTATGLWRKLLLGSIVVACLGQSVLTLSRGGFYVFIGAAAPALFFLMGDAKSRIRVLAFTLTLTVLAVFVVFPLLDGYTEGAITRRFEERGMTGRERLMNIDIEVWLDNPIFGVGVGRSSFHHLMSGHLVMTHNEFTRTLAEHGVFGILALMMLAVAAVERMFLARSMQERGIAAALITWSLLFLYVNGMRLAAPSFTFALAMLALRPERTHAYGAVRPSSW
jgi:hypothetical protein